MFANLSNLKKAGLFYILVMTMNVTLVLYFRSVAPQNDIVIPIDMLTPTLTVIIMLFIVTRDGYSRDGRASLGLGRSGWRSWGVALLLPLPVLAVSYGLGWMTSSAMLVLPADNAWLPKLLIRIPFILLGILLALFEEIGFRGYLLPRLLELGPKRAVILSGFLHATWHLPILLLTPFWTVGGSRFLTIPVFLLVLTAAGTIYGSLQLTTSSVWPAAILHGSFNFFLDVFTELTLVASPLAFYLVGESGVLTLILVAIAAIWFIQRPSMSGKLMPALGKA